MTAYRTMDERTPLTKTAPPDYVYMTNPNKLYRKQVHQFQCCICSAVLTIFCVVLAISILYFVDTDTIDTVPDLPPDNASLQLLLAKSWPLPDSGIPEWQIELPTPEEVEEAIAEGKKSLAIKDSMEASNPSLPVNSPSYRHQVSIKTSARATNLARSAYIMQEATKSLLKKKGKSKNKSTLKKKTVGKGPKLSSSWLPTEECGEGPLPACPSSKYRSIDGSCNNLYKPSQWGVAMRPYRRQLTSQYSDGVSAPRVSADGSPLPSARDVSVTVHRPAYRDDPKFTVMLAVWGQFMDHDVTATALSLGAGGKPISCCQNVTSKMHPECYPVFLSKDDPYYNQFGLTCLEFVRSAPAPTCAMGPREQMNQVSSYLDGSVVYGNTAELSRALRSYQGGQLKMLETSDGRSLLPISTILDDGCNRESENAKGRYCFMTGDTRANENTHLTSLHLLMARQHNQLASQLAELNPEWNDEKVYQEARKIVAAQMQHVTYNEFLPVLLGPDMMERLELSPQKDGYYKGYDPSVDATISNNFATSAFRFAHTLLPALMKTVAKDWNSEESVEMHKMLFDPYKLYQTGALDKVLQGALNTHLERADSYFNTQVTQHLFQATGEDDKPTAPRYGLDLVSLNVQRGRDHGLPSYPVWREYCGLSRPITFDDLDGVIDSGSLERIKSMYKSVDDVDMYTGALSEFPIQGGLVGPTITCLVSDQFKRLKQGDSFWYETDKQPQAFTLDQLNEIRKTTLARIICDTSDEVTMLQPEVMKSVNSNNTRVTCSALPQMDLTKWAESLKAPASGVKTKYSRIEVTVTGGSIKSSSGDVNWDGTVPVVIPVPLFDVRKTSAMTPGGLFGQGIQWKGILSATSSSIEVSGVFSYPVFEHGPIPLGTNYTPKWVNGDFKLDAIVTLNDTDISLLSLPGNYQSPIFLSEEKVNLTEKKQQFILSAQDDTPLVNGDQILPLILTGSYSPDKTGFYWSGKAVIKIPVAVTPLLTSSSTVSPKDPSISGVFNVISGNVKLDSADGSATVVWDGTLPIAIPLPSPYKVLMAPGSGEKLTVFGNGLVWSTSITGSSLEGSFTFPQYNRTLGFVTVEWLNGQFSLQVTQTMNVTLDELITPGLKYVSRIIFRQEPTVPYLQIKDVFNSDETSGSLENLVVESEEVIDGVITAPLILHGTFSPDKTKFYFNGKVILAVKPTKPKMYKQLQSLKSPEIAFPFYRVRKFGGVVNSGHVSGGLIEGEHHSKWKGSFPVAFPAPTFYSPLYDTVDRKSFIFDNGVVWSGKLKGSIMKGTYSLPQTLWSIDGKTKQTWTGKFSFDISPLWNTTLKHLFVSGSKYYSKIYFQGAKHQPGLNSWKGVPGENSEVTMSAPIVLQGSYSHDRRTFYWSGSFIMLFRNKPLRFTIPTTPSIDVNKVPKTTTSFQIDVSSGSITAEFAGANSNQVWSGTLPATIPYGYLVSKDSWSTTVPSSDILWTGEVKNGTLQGTFAVATYKQNGATENVDWFTGNFTFKYTIKYSQYLLEDYVKPGKKFDFQMRFIQPKLSNVNSEDKSPNSLVQFVQEAQDVLNEVKIGKILLRGNFYSKPFYCYFMPLCTEKKEFYWSGSAILVFPEPPINKTEGLQLTKVDDVEIESTSSQFGGQVVAGFVEGGLDKETSNGWWSGELPVQIPTSIFWTNKTGTSAVMAGGHRVDWSGTLTGNTLKGSFTFPQLVADFPVPTVRQWSGQFSFDFQPLWNTSLNGLIQSGVKYSSGLFFQGLKIVDVDGDKNKNLYLGVDDSTVVPAPIILQGTFSPDGASFLWSGKFMISIKKYPLYPSVKTEGKYKIQDDSVVLHKLSASSKAPKAPKPVKPKTTVSFSVISGTLSASNGSDPVQLWGGKMPINISKELFNPYNTPGAGISFTWSADSLFPQLNGTFTTTVYYKNESESVLLPITWSGNFSFYYLIKWSGSFIGLVKPGKLYSCSVIFKELTKSSLNSPGYIDEPTPERFVVGATEAPPAPCILLVNGMSSLVGDPFYCQIMPFMCTGKTQTNRFLFNGDAMLIIRPPPVAPPEPTDDPEINDPEPANEPLEDFILGLEKPKYAPLNNMFVSARQIMATVVSGSIVAGPESEYPKTLWSGDLPVEIPIPDFWYSGDTTGSTVLPEDILHPHGVIWSGSQMGPRIEGSFSIPQYSNIGMQWWTGRFSFLLQTKWGALGDLDGLISSGVKYNSKIVFRDLHSPTPLLAPSQFDIDTATEMPLILLGTYSPTRTVFYWSGDVIIGLRNNPSLFLNKSPVSSLQIESGTKPFKPYSKPSSRVGVEVITGNLTSNSEGSLLPLWSGSLPAMIPLAQYNVSNGVDVIWSATTLYPMFTGNYSIPQYVKNTEGFKIQWTDGTFSFNVTPLWNTSLDIIEIGKQYATIVFGNSSKLTKADQEEMYSSFLSLILESANITGSPIGRLNIQGTLTPDNLFFSWIGQAWFYQGKNTTVSSNNSLHAVATIPLTPLRANQYGGAVYDGFVTSKSSSFFSFTSTIWSGKLPAEIPFFAFWSGSIAGAKFTKGVTWTASAVQESFLAGSYSIPQYSWDGITTSVTWYKGDFQLYLRPLWNSTLSTLIQPGTQYYSKISFQGEKTPTLGTEQVVPGVQAPIILQGSYSPDHISFFWTGNFIMTIKGIPIMG